MKRILLVLAIASVCAAPAAADSYSQAAGVITTNGGAAQSVAADDQVRIVVPARNIARGETISESDLTYVDVPAARVGRGIVTSMNDLSGMQTRRFLRAGESVRSDDVRHPILVTKGSTVTMTFDAPGLTLTAVGKAMSEGGIGESVIVQNPVSFRQVTATVTGPGAVRAGSLTATVSDASSTYVTAQN